MLKFKSRYDFNLPKDSLIIPPYKEVYNNEVYVGYIKSNKNHPAEEVKSWNFVSFNPEIESIMEFKGLLKELKEILQKKF